MHVLASDRCGRRHGRAHPADATDCCVHSGGGYPDEQVHEFLAQTAAAIGRREADRMTGRGP